MEEVANIANLDAIPDVLIYRQPILDALARAAELFR